MEWLLNFFRQLFSKKHMHNMVEYERITVSYAIYGDLFSEVVQKTMKCTVCGFTEKQVERKIS